MNYAQIRAFHAVAETKSFTAAAEKLFLTQPAVTLQLKAIQDHYGLTLLYRNGHKVILTKAGEELYSLTKRFFSIVREIDEYLDSVDSMKYGHLSIGADSPFHVMKLMASFRKKYPDITISIALGNTKEVHQKILDYQTDIAVIAKPEDNPKIDKIPYCHSPLVVIVSKNHPWKNRRSIKFEELDGVDMIQREQGSATRACFEKGLQESQIKPNFVFEVGTREAVREAVIQNMGIAILQESEVGSDSNQHILKISNKQLELEEYIIFLNERKNSRIISVFIQLVKSEINLQSETFTKHLQSL